MGSERVGYSSLQRAVVSLSRGLLCVLLQERKLRHDDVVVAQGRAKSSELSAIRKILANRV